jgi:glycosyltransferase involved in cell wall biosynthesis
MRIAYVITRGDSVGGASIHVRDLSEAMRARGHEVLVLLGGSGAVTAELDRVGVQFQTVPWLQKAIHPLRDVAAITEIIRALRAFRPDLISTHTAKAGFAGRAAAHRLGVPAVFTPHGWAVGDRLGRMRGHIFTLAERMAAPWTAAFVNVCEAERQLALSRGIGEPSRHHVIYNGVHDVGPELRAEPAGSEGPVRIVCTARFEAPKDHSTLLEALASVSGAWRLELIGDGPLEAEFRARYAADERIVFHGYLGDPAPMLARAHLFVLSSRSEAFPRSILEAMRAGLPVVATDVGGVREAVSDANGVVVPPGDSAALRQALQQLLQSPRKRQLMGAVGHQIYRERFRFGLMSVATELLYEKLT